MTVKELAASCELGVLCHADGERNVNGAYVGDLLSWVMGRANENNAWITIMSNLNIIAVASLADPSCIILSEGVTVDDAVRARAEAQGVNLLSSELDTFALCATIAKEL